MFDSAKRKRVGSCARKVTRRFDPNGAMEMWNEALAAARGEQ
jgi:hypothetical protein